MNFSVRQWLLSIALDMLIKISLITYLGVLITSTAAPGFVFMAVMQSLFHFGCLLAGCTFVAALELVHLKPSRGVRFLIAVIVGNAAFVLFDAAFFALPSMGDFWSRFVTSLPLEFMYCDNQSCSDPDGRHG